MVKIREYTFLGKNTYFEMPLNTRFKTKQLLSLIFTLSDDIL